VVVVDIEGRGKERERRKERRLTSETLRGEKKK